jgi:hypothetical protein
MWFQLLNRRKPLYPTIPSLTGAILFRHLSTKESMLVNVQKNSLWIGPKYWLLIPTLASTFSATPLINILSHRFLSGESKGLSPLHVLSLRIALSYSFYADHIDFTLQHQLTTDRESNPSSVILCVYLPPSLHKRIYAC